MKLPALILWPFDIYLREKMRELKEYLSKQQLSRIKNNIYKFKKAKKEYPDADDELLQRYRYRNLSDYEHDIVNQFIFEYKKYVHTKFVKYCLAPEGYVIGNGEVFACVVGMEKINEINYVNISLVTPSMAYIDNRYFVSGNDNDDYIWWEDYRPYYYELVAHLTDEELEKFDNQIFHLKTISEYDDRSRLQIPLKQHADSDRTACCSTLLYRKLRNRVPLNWNWCTI